MENKEFGLIYKRMADVNRRIQAITKSNENRQQNFKFRGIDSIYNGIHSALSESEVFCIPRIIKVIKDREITTSKGNIGYHVILEIEYDFIAPDGSSVTSRVWGEGIDYGDKVINKCMAIAHKYALIQIFTIPTEDLIDPDQSNPTDENNQNNEADETDEKSTNNKNKDQQKQSPKIDPNEKMLAHFETLGVNKKMLQYYIKKPLESITEQDKTNLLTLSKRLKSGENFSDIIEEKSAKNTVENLF